MSGLFFFSLISIGRELSALGPRCVVCSLLCIYGLFDFIGVVLVYHDQPVNGKKYLSVDCRQLNLGVWVFGMF